MKGKIILLLALLFFTCPLNTYPATDLKITRCEPVKFFGEPPYILLSYEYPQDFKKPGVEITVNGRKPFSVPAGSGFGGGMTSETSIVYVGPPGKKHFKVMVKSADTVLTATQTIDFRSEGEILLLDRADGETILSGNAAGESAIELHFFGYFLRDLKMALNGDKLKFHLEPIKVSADHFQISCRPDLRQGENTLVLNWKSDTSRSRSQQYHFYLAKNGEVRQGDTINIRLGRLQSKSGPFYRAAVKGNCLEMVKGAVLAKQVVLRKGFYLSQDLIDLAIFKGKQPGKGVIGIYKKGIFFKPFELNRLLDLTVVQ